MLYFEIKQEFIKNSNAVMHSKQIDSLDTLALLGDRERFATSVEWIGKNLQFDIVSKGLL